MPPKTLPNHAANLLRPFPYLIVHGEEGEQVLPLTNADFWTIGRGYNNSIVLTDKWVSRNHATIQIVGKHRKDGDAGSGATQERLGRTAEGQTDASVGFFYLVDLGSSNGSFVGDRRVTYPVLLRNGDRITIGKTEMEFYTPHTYSEGELQQEENLNKRTAPVTARVVPFPAEAAGREDRGMSLGGGTGSAGTTAARSILTPSEERVFWQVVQGFTNKEIGSRLQISPRTVQTHLSSIMTKLNLANRAQIVRFAYEHSHRPPDSTELM